ncbi:MAG: TAXI family TRAP transporter solute-binding subunit [Hyphomicrobiaceae bacterium]
MKLRQVGAAGVAALVLAIGSGAATAETKLTYFTGPTGGSWIPIGGALKNIWEKSIPGVSVENRPGAGLVNLKAIEEGKADIGMGNLITTVDAIAGKGTGITKPYTNVCHLGSLYPNVAQFVVRSDLGIKSLADLKGKAVGTLPRGNTTTEVAGWIMDAAGVGFKGASKMAFASLSDMANMFKDGQIVASFMVTTQGNGSIKDMANSRKIGLLDIPDNIYAQLKTKNAGFQRYTLPKATYPGLEKDNITAAFPAHVIVSCKLPDDLAYKMAKAMVGALPDLVHVNSSFKGKTAKDIGAKVDVKWHPGALKYYKEIGAQ